MARRLPVFVIGTRAQLIKVAPVVVACELAGLNPKLLMTGQHQETMQDLINEFGIASEQVSALPARERATVGSLLRWLPKAYVGVHKRLAELAPHADGLDVLVHGDTLSTLLGALAGKRCGARVIHLESGLSSGDLLDPFPEEICRRLVFRMTDVAMCPDATSAGFMRKHHRKAVTVETGGNTIVDAVALASVQPGQQEAPYIVASLHRFQNLYDSDRLKELVGLLEATSGHYPIHFVLHPATRNRLLKEGLFARLEARPGIRLLPRLGYRDFLRLTADAACVLTDGGSNQEELAVLGVPTIVMRARTERLDGLGANAIMEADAPGGVADYLRDGGFQRQRRRPSMPAGHGPSHLIATYLQQ